jgi:hypothetical protein
MIIGSIYRIFLSLRKSFTNLITSINDLNYFDFQRRYNYIIHKIIVIFFLKKI